MKVRSDVADTVDEVVTMAAFFFLGWLEVPYIHTTAVSTRRPSQERPKIEKDITDGRVGRSRTSPTHIWDVAEIAQRCGYEKQCHHPSSP